MPAPHAPGSIIPTSAPDEETRTAAETLKVLQRQQLTAGFPKAPVCQHHLVKLIILKGRD